MMKFFQLKKPGRFWTLILVVALVLTGLNVSSANAKKVYGKTIKLSKTKVTLTAGDTLKLKAIVAPKKATVTWKSSNKAIAKVNKKGKVSAIKAGKAEITASITLKNGKTKQAKCKVTVKKGGDGPDNDGTNPDTPVPGNSSAPQDTNPNNGNQANPGANSNPSTTASPQPTSNPMPTLAPTVNTASTQLITGVSCDNNSVQGVSVYYNGTRNLIQVFTKGNDIKQIRDDIKLSYADASVKVEVEQYSPEAYFSDKAPGYYKTIVSAMEDGKEVKQTYFIGICGQFKTKTSKNNKVKVEGYSGSCEQLSVPAVLDGKNVCSCWLFGSDNLTEVIIPEGVRRIKYIRSDNLKSVQLPESVKIIDTYALAWNTNLSSINIPNNIRHLGAYAFYETKWKENLKAYGNGLVISGNAIIDGSNAEGEITIPSNITCIAEGAFYENKEKLTGIKFRSGCDIKLIPTYCFYGCSKLASVTLPDSLKKIDRYAFVGCTLLENVTLPDSIKRIGKEAFMNCTSLTEMHFPDTMTFMGFRAFYGCKSLENITCTKNLSFIGGEAFTLTKWIASEAEKAEDGLVIINGCLIDGKAASGDVAIPSTVSAIGACAFYGNENLTAISIPDGVKKIGTSTFANNSNLNAVSIPDTVTSIERYAFKNCTSLTEISLLSGIEEINNYCFSNCTSLEEIVIPDSVTYVGYSAFEKCTSLYDITLPSSLVDFYGAFDDTPWMINQINSAANGLVIINKVLISGKNAVGKIDLSKLDVDVMVSDAFQGASNITEINIPGNLKIQGYTLNFADCTNLGKCTLPGNCKSFSFRNCTSLTDVAIPASITVISYSAFYKCTSLKSIIIPGSVTSIRDYAFYDCTALRSITIPDSVTRIGERAFYGCTALCSMTIPDSVTSIESYAFGNCTSLADLVISKNCMDFGAYPFYNTAWREKKMEEVRDTTGMVVVNGVYLGGWCYSGVVTIKGTVSAMPQYMWYGETIVKEVVIEEGVNTIGYGAFSDCSNLTKVTLPASLTRISSYAFANANSSVVFYVKYGTEAYNFVINNNLNYKIY